MRFHRIYIALLILGISEVITLKAQEPATNDFLAWCQSKYGSDADLVNGEKYFYPYAASEGDPFFVPTTQSTLLRVKGKEFENQQIKYDIYSQQLVLDYTDVYGATTSLVLRNEWIESFSFGTFLFNYMDGPEGEAGFFQVVFEGNISCYYGWRKEYQLNLTSGVQSYYFTDPISSAFMVQGKNIHSFRNNRTFLKAFKREEQRDIKLFLRESRIRVNKASDTQMRHLLEYCNTLYDESS